MIIKSIGRLALIGPLCALLVGCANNQTAEVTGTVTVDGRPAEKGSITFLPADGMSATSGDTIEGGKYTAKNVPVGTMRVEIRVPKVTGRKKLYDTKDSAFRETFSESLPKKYNSATELRFDVEPGENEKNWALSTR
jgi:hypothetical protein